MYGWEEHLEYFGILETLLHEILHILLIYLFGELGNEAYNSTLKKKALKFSSHKIECCCSSNFNLS